VKCRIQSHTIKFWLLLYPVALIYQTANFFTGSIAKIRFVKFSAPGIMGQQIKALLNALNDDHQLHLWLKFTARVAIFNPVRVESRRPYGVKTNPGYGRPMEYGRPLYFCLVVSFYLLFSSPNLSGRRLDVDHTSPHGVALVRI